MKAKDRSCFKKEKTVNFIKYFSQERWRQNIIEFSNMEVIGNFLKRRLKKWKIFNINPASIYQGDNVR